jgi:mono/diheme cytochrome c family protein
MQFPVFQVPVLGNGLTIALNAVLHVFISHGVSIGAIGLIVLAEYYGWKKNNPDWEKLARDFLGVLVIVITGVGAVTGAGIWITASALSPRAIGSIIRIFFWPWFIEWGVFLTELILLLVYYFLWTKVGPERKVRHIRLGLAYVLMALFSAVLITGILGFMLTPDGWPARHRFWPAFFNPTFWPQVLLRIAEAFLLGAVFMLTFLLLTRRPPEFRRESLPVFGRVLLHSSAALVIFGGWYYLAVPAALRTQALFSVLTSHLSQTPQVFFWVNGLGMFCLLALGLVTLGRGRWAARLLIGPALLASLLIVAQVERMREFMRGPYLLPGYMFTNQVLLKEKPFFDREGILAQSVWFNLAAPRPGADTETARGAYLFAQNCSMCHTLSGVNAMDRRLRGRPEDGIRVIIGHTHDLVPFMPPFSGTDEELQTLAAFLYGIARKSAPPQTPSRFAPWPVEKTP